MKPAAVSMSERQVLRARELYPRFSVRAIAAELGVGRTAVFKAVTGKRHRKYGGQITEGLGYAAKALRTENTPASSRFLNAAAKQRILREWENSQRGQPAPGNDGGGHGFVDRAIVPLCNALNALDGICTVQSCSGHQHPDGSQSCGVLWLRMDARVAALYHARAFDLALIEGMERIETLYSSWGEEIAAVTFAGLNRGDRELRRSSRAILGFFRGITGAAR